MHLSALLAILPLAAGASVPLVGRAEPAPLLTPEHDDNVTLSSEYLVKFKDGTHETIVHQVLKNLNGNSSHVFDEVFHGFSKDLNQTELDYVRDHQDVEYVESNQIVQGDGSGQLQLATQKNAPWNLARISHRQRGPTSYIYDKTAGKGTCTYVIDSGLDETHTEFGGRARHLISFIPGEKTDDFGYGTHIAGIIGGITYGVAKETNIYGVKVLDKNNQGKIDGFVKGLDYVAKHQAQMRRQGKCVKGVVINLSISTGPSQMMNDAASRLINKDVFLAVSAGNGNIAASKRSPAKGAAVCVVGGTNSEDKLYSDPPKSLASNYGKRVDIFAPGEQVLSAATNVVTGGQNIGGYMSGTSQAVPHVAGIAACLAAKEHLSGTKALCDRIKQLGTKDAIVNQKKNTVNLLAYNSAEEEPSNETVEQGFCDANSKEGCSPQIERPFGLEAVTTGEDLNACSHFKRLHIRLVTAGAVDAGTWDNININFGKKDTLLAQSPYRNEVDEVDIDPQKGFGATDKQIRVSDIKKFTLSLRAIKNGDSLDWWKLKGITLVGTCAGSSRVAQITKFEELYKWMERSGTTESYTGEIKLQGWRWQTEDKETETLAMQPPGRPDACSHFKTLEVGLKLGNGPYQGTWDDVDLCFDARPKCVTLAREPEHGFDQTTQVNLEDVFGSKVIPAPGFRAIKVYSKTGAHTQDSDTDWWVYNGITFRGHCAGSPRVVEALKFSTRNDWVIRKKGQKRTEIESGELAANEWRWLKKD